MSQQEMFPTKPAPAPIKVGDVIVTNGTYRARHRVRQIDDNVDGLVFVCVNLDTGADSIVLAREVARVVER
jgi:hypothetical protein